MNRRFLTQAQCDRLRVLCVDHSMTEAARIVGCQRDTVRDARNRGWHAAKGKRRRRRPSDFAVQARRLTRKQLEWHYHAGTTTVRRWAEEIGLGRRKPDKTNPSLPRPDGSKEARDLYGALGTPEAFEKLLAEKGSTATAEIYGVSYGTVRRWRQRFGLPFSWSRQPGAKRDMAAPLPPSPRRKDAGLTRAEKQRRAARAAIADFTTRQHARARREREQAY